MARSAVRGGLVALAAGLALAGCGGHPAAAPSPGSPAATPSPGSPGGGTGAASPVVVLHTAGPCTLGQPVTVRDPSTGAAEQVLVEAPAVRTTAFSGYAYGPRYGYYVSFPTTVRDVGSQPIVINPLDFTVVTAAHPAVDIYNGNAKFSGTSASLEHTFVVPGQAESGPLTFDVAAPHGTLVYARAGSTVCTWAF